MSINFYVQFYFILLTSSLDIQKNFFKYNYKHYNDNILIIIIQETNKMLFPLDGCRLRVYYIINTRWSRTYGHLLYACGKSSVLHYNHIME